MLIPGHGSVRLRGAIDHDGPGAGPSVPLVRGNARHAQRRGRRQWSRVTAVITGVSRSARGGNHVRLYALAYIPLVVLVAPVLSSCSSPNLPDAIPGLNGTVRDAESNTPIAGATVQAAGKSTVSEANGWYSFGSLSYRS